MAGIVVCGAGACGLVTAMLLAKDGHEVTVLERDPAEPPAPAEAWDAWERRGVNQFRLPHMLMPRWRHEVARELPELVMALEAAGALKLNFFGPFRDVIAEPDRFEVLTARRPPLEAVIASVAAATAGVEIRRGVAIAGVEVGASSRPGIPHVTGVRLESGDVVEADLVIAATGRRSPLGRWLDAIGARRPIEEQEDSGFVYYGRHVRSLDGSMLVDSPGLREFGSLGLIQLPADDGTAGIGVVATSDDAPLRALRQEDAWQRVMRALPGGEPLLESTPISPLVSMAAIEDVYRRYVVDGEPVAIGIVAVADAWAATNPTLGRGIALGTRHAIALRDVVRAHLEDPYELAAAFDEVTEREFTPWYRATVWQDRHKLADFAAAARGEVYEGDQRWRDFVALTALMGADLEVATTVADSTTFLSRTPLDLLADPDVQAKVPGDAPPRAHNGPTRQELLDLIAG